MESFISYSLPISSGVANIWVPIPKAQQGPNDTDFNIWLPAGMHTVIMQWEGAHPRIYAKIWKGAHTFTGLLGGEGAGLQMATIIIPPGGGKIGFQQNLPVSEEQAAAFPNTLGVNIILGATREG